MKGFFIYDVCDVFSQIFDISVNNIFITVTFLYLRTNKYQSENSFCKI